MWRTLLLVIGCLAGLTACDMEGVDEGSRPIVRDDCHVGGCSSQICSDEPGVGSTCEWLPEYECYRTATCERQPDGACGWTGTQELEACLQGDDRRR
jgi:hypothetical protein